ncbi:hypothetical protein FACS1894166_05740 [Bacilli bacterium]|nr:hypothetical protein FACS1894166_05740 [Bacilli bacterium]
MGKLNSKLCYVLNNGVQIPIIGLGTCHIYDGEHAQAVKAIKTAIKSGYRLIDTAQFYDNETAVGQAVKESGVLRNQLFIVSKL